MASALVGKTFTHPTLLDPGWQPEPGQRMSSAPKATMVITRATKTTVWYRIVGSSRGFSCEREKFLRQYRSLLDSKDS